jgi:RimJ/RimL family protein N-acetyltransferase
MASKYNFPETIITDRFMLEKVSEEFHAEEAYEVIDRNRKYIGEFLDWCTPEYNLEDTIGFYKMQSENFDEEESFDFVIIDNESDAIIGSIGIVVKSRGVGAVGYWLDAEQQGRGVMGECLNELIKVAFTESNFIRLNLHTLAENVKSQKVAKRAGFVFDSVIYSHRVNAKGELEDVYQYVLIKDEERMQILKSKSEEIEKAYLK